jgi:nucleoid DNA-binding protein
MDINNIKEQIEKRKTINKDSFIKFLTENKFFKTKKEAEECLNKILKGIEKAMEEGNNIRFSGFGKFYLKSKIIKGTSNNTKNKLTIVPSFESGKNLKEKIKNKILK